jgi:hypothetical protein
MAIELFAGNSGRRLRRGTHLVRAAVRAAAELRPQRVESVWELAEHRYVYIVQRDGLTGGTVHTVMVEGLDDVVAGIFARGIEPALPETYDSGVRKITYRGPEGNEFAYGEAPPA